MYKTLFTICLFLLFGNLFAQEDIVVGKTYDIYSESLTQQIKLQVYLPNAYDEVEEDYPTLYILDGQWFFTNGVTIQESLRGDRFMPKMIVVGINMVDRPYRSKLFNQWDNLIAFIESELVPFVNESFRASDQRIVFGWENSGFLASELVLRENSPFDCAIASNGAYINEDLLGSLELQEERFFFIGGSKKDIYSISDTDEAAEVLASSDLENLNWKYQLFNEEVHESLTYTSLYHGLKFFYHNYSSLVFSSMDEFYDKGGMPYLRQYFKERGGRFGFSTEIDASTKNSLIWLAWKRDKFESFDLFMTEFEDVLSTRRYANAYWQNRLAQFYLKYGSYDKAISFFNRGIEAYSEEEYTAEMHAGRGLAYHGKGNKKLAKSNLKKSVEIASSQDDPRLKEYQEQLKRVRN
ncbi:MAG: alpha/beta hydrolase-fold protein [Ekhidna sp.]